MAMILFTNTIMAMLIAQLTNLKTELGDIFSTIKLDDLGACNLQPCDVESLDKKLNKFIEKHQTLIRYPSHRLWGR